MVLRSLPQAQTGERAQGSAPLLPWMTLPRPSPLAGLAGDCGAADGASVRANASVNARSRTAVSPIRRVISSSDQPPGPPTDAAVYFGGRACQRRHDVY